MEAWTFTGRKYRDVAACVGMRSRRPTPKGTGLGKGFYKFVTMKKEVQGHVLPSEPYRQAADKEKVKVLNNFLPQSSLAALFTPYANG